MICEHLDYNDYFGRCPDCNKSGETVHREEFPEHILVKEQDDDEVYLECQQCDFATDSIEVEE